MLELPIQLYFITSDLLLAAVLPRMDSTRIHLSSLHLLFFQVVSFMAIIDKIWSYICLIYYLQTSESLTHLQLNYSLPKHVNSISWSRVKTCEYQLISWLRSKTCEYQLISWLGSKIFEYQLISWLGSKSIFLFTHWKKIM